MLALTTRQRDILRVILDVNRPIGSVGLAEILHLTPRQVTYNMQWVRVWLKQHDQDLAILPGVGFVVAIASDHARELVQKINIQSGLQIILSVSQRQQLLALFLLLHPNGDIMAEQKTTRIYMVRHGATQLSAEDRFAGAVNVELSDEGKFQAARLAERLADDDIAAVYCSPLTRTVQTATILASPRSNPLFHRDGLREIHHGHWEGMRRADVESQFPDEYAAWEEDPFTFAPQGGEAGVNVIARALPVIREIVLEHRGQNVLVVSHKATLRLLISSLLGFDARGYRDRLDQSPACLNVLDFKDAVRVRLMLFNDISHYANQPLRPGEQLSKWWDTPKV